MSDAKTPEEIEFYSASVNAWYNSSLEHDKSLLTLSAAGIGLLITLLTTTGLKGYVSFGLYILALGSFIACLISVLLIFQGNKSHIIKLFNGEDFDNPYLERIDRVAMWSFISGVIFSAIIGIATATQQLNKKETKMSDNPKQNHAVAINSFNGAQLLQKSFTGVQQLKPQSTTTTSGAQASQSATTPAAAETTQKPACNDKKS